MRIIALDVHRSSAQTAILENGKLRDAGKVDLERNRLLQFARKLKLDDEIVIEATGNTSSIVTSGANTSLQSQPRASWRSSSGTS